jgi:ATP-dependent HslUV protease subunit HslV
MNCSIRKLLHSQSSLRSFQGTLRSFHATPSLATTIICVRKNGKVCLMGDGMVSQGSIIVKPNAVKIRRIMPKGSSDSDKASGGTLVGFAGSTADAFTLLERLEQKLDEYPGQLKRSCVELAKGWRTDKYLRRLEASLIVADASASLELTGNGDVLESHDGILGVGSGSPYAIGKRTRLDPCEIWWAGAVSCCQNVVVVVVISVSHLVVSEWMTAAARALKDFPDLSAEEVAQKAMNVAADMCIYTNKEFLIESLEAKEEKKE